MTRSDYFRFRTGASGLTDDEFLLLDALFGHHVEVAFFTEANFCDFFNLPFLHSFTDTEVFERFDDWISQGLVEFWEDIHPRTKKSTRICSLSPTGGALWESERLPVWERYYEWSQDFGRRECVLEVRSPTRSLTKTLVRAAERRGELRTVGHWRIRPWSGDDDWRPFLSGWALRVRIEERYTYGSAYWQQVRREQIGWRNPTELIELRLDGKLPWPA